MASLACGPRLVALERLPSTVSPISTCRSSTSARSTRAPGSSSGEDRHVPDREGVSAIQRREVRRVQIAPGAVDGPGVDELGRRNQQRQTEVIQRIQQILNSLPTGNQAAVHRALRSVQHPVRADHRLRRPPGRAPALRPRVQHHRAADRAARRGGLGVGRRRKVRQISVKPQPRPSSTPKGSRSWTWFRRQQRELSPAERRSHVGGWTNNSTPTTSSRSSSRWRTSSSERSAPTRRRSTSRTSAGSSIPTRRRPRSSDRRPARRLPQRQQAAGRNTIAVVDRVRELIPRMIGVPPGVKLGITLDQSIYIRQAIQSLGTRRSRARSRVLVDPDLPALLTPRSSSPSPSRSRSSVVHLPLLPRSDAQRVHARGPGARGGTAGGRLDRRARDINRHLNIPGTSRRRAVLTPRARWRCRFFSATITTIIVFLPTIFLGGAAQAPLHPAHLHHLGLAVRVVPRLPDRHAATRAQGAPAGGADRPARRGGSGTASSGCPSASSSGPRSATSD